MARFVLSGWRVSVYAKAAVPLLLVSALTVVLEARRSTRWRDYSSYVTGTADTILDVGLDRAGEMQTPLWAGVINTEDWSVPTDDVPTVAGIRPNDRSVGGCNLYHDIETLRAFRVLSQTTGKPKYAAAAKEYLDFYLRNARSGKTGFLAWGEHLYYDFTRDGVATERKWHEFGERTPPWEQLWEVNPKAVEEEISAIRYHYFSGQPGGLFNRHAFFDRPEHQTSGQPWIKHSGLHAYSFMFLYSKTRDRTWLAWSRAAADLYWKRRNPDTNLTPSCIGDPRPQAQCALIEQTKLAYWLLKTYQLHPRETNLWKKAAVLLKAWDHYAWDKDRDVYHASLHLEGMPASDELVPIWNFAYGKASILVLGRIAAYFARTEDDPAFIEIARRVARIAKAIPPPEDVTAEGLAFALNLNMDLHDLTNGSEYLNDARFYADAAVTRLWVKHEGGGIFVRTAGDPYYEAMTGVGDLLSGFLRLHFETNRYASDPGSFDWSF